MRNALKTACRVLVLGAVTCTANVAVAANSDKHDKLVAIAERLTEQQHHFNDELNSLRELLGVGSPLETVKPLTLPDSASPLAKRRTREGNSDFLERRYESAKEAFQDAWEAAPNNAISYFNLGLAYERLGNKPLAKKMLKAALDMDSKISHADKLREFVEARADTSSTKPTAASAEKSDKDPELSAAHTDMTNLKKQVDSYLTSQTLPLSQRLHAAAHALNRMIDIAQGNNPLIREFFLDMAERYSSFEMYGKSLQLFADYEKSMDGKVLPDGYHKSLLQIREKQREQEEILAAYRNNEPDHAIARKLNRDLRELKIFSSQLEEFVANPVAGDRDFDKVCQRLKEYRWGDKSNRHVIVTSRFQELLFSSLPGTLPLDRYQDDDGQKFFKNITLLANTLDNNHTDFAEVNLNINGTTVPYIVMYSYVPKHEALIIVRLPRRNFEG